jgi:membrane-bound acyltransferase YfiQ involved in biofilm formation
VPKTAAGPTSTDTNAFIVLFPNLRFCWLCSFFGWFFTFALKEDEEKKDE